ncbi:MAG: hypothetical protein IPF79_04520 [Ignavibacteria bacterium]|nr:hypothetical protein [Ignavibacteria bacterium]
MKILIALVLLITSEVAAQPITLERGRLWGDSVAWFTPDRFIFDYAEDANLLFIPLNALHPGLQDLTTGLLQTPSILSSVFRTWRRLLSRRSLARETEEW